MLVAIASATSQDSDTKGLRWSKQQGLEYRLKAGFNIGGTAPIPLPVEIRKINKYDPLLQISVGVDFLKWFDNEYEGHQFAFMTGIEFESKGMKTDATVKNYQIKMIAESGGGMSGRWTGNVITEIHNTYITVPFAGIMKIDPRWSIKAGGFVSYQLKGHFSGEAYNGYLRDGDPTGQKIVFDGDSKAIYDFSEDLQSWQVGGILDGEWRAFEHLSIFTDLSWGFMPIFKKEFTTISFPMYPIYLNFGFAYIF